jgi:1,4-alpha-glucan branching enzyme
MPVEEHPFDGSWGYQVTGYYAPTSRYGNPDEFMAFVDRCHQNNIGVLLDWVPAHFPKDAHGLGRFDGTALYEHEDSRRGEHPDWGTYIFNYGRNEVKNFLIGNAIFWLEKYHIDGLRVDAVASMLYLDYGKTDGQWVANQYGGNHNLDAVEFMKHMNSVIESRCPGTLMIAEESTAWAGVSRPAKYDGLGFNLKWNMGWMNDFLTYISKDCIYRKYHHNDLTFGMVYAYTENFILVLSHDEVVHGKGSLINKMPGDLWQKFANLRVAYGFMYGHPGKKLLFMGGEFGQFEEWSEAKSLNWFLLEYDHHRQMQSYVKDLNQFYLEHEPLWLDDFTSGGFEWINGGDWEKSLVTFFRRGKTEKDIVIFVCNFTPVPLTEHRIGVPFAGQYREVFNSDDQKYGGSGVVNTKIFAAEKRSWDGRPYSIGLRVPPLAVTIIKPV